MAVVDSDNFAYDDFLWSAFNGDGAPLFSLDFDNNDLNVYYLPNDNSGYQVTGAAFTNGNIYDLVITMDFARNRWSATLGHAPVVTEQPLSANPAVALNLGGVDASWLPLNMFAPGDNALVFDEYRLTAEPSEVPAIVLPPQNQSVAAGANVTFAVVASGGEPLRYLWQWNGANLPGATDAILTLYSVSAVQAGNYTVTVSNVMGNVSATAALTVNLPAAPAFSATRLLPDQQFQFTLGGTAGARYLIEYSDDLVQWQELTTVTMTASTATLSDPEAGTKSKHFYRARAVF